MRLVFFTHPNFLDSQSMPRFARMLSDGMENRGHAIELWTAKAYFFNLAVPLGLKKWMGYIDQYLIFPIRVKRLLKTTTPDTLFVFTDHALGPWVPMVANRPHVIHCHDFLAQQSALDKFVENKTSWTGRQYQAYIRRGYTQGKNFISVSEKTRENLHEFLGHVPDISRVVYNGVNRQFVKHDAGQARIKLNDFTGFNVLDGYILHVGGNQWYKNRYGVVKTYDAWRKSTSLKLPLLLIGQNPSAKILEACKTSAYSNDIHILTAVNDELVNLAYSGAELLFFPSIAEGFGWPIVEAMASGCPVITTNAAPMTEVAGDGAYLLPIMPANEIEVSAWADNAAMVVNEVINLDGYERDELLNKGLLNVLRFDQDKALDDIERIYSKIINKE